MTTSTAHQNPYTAPGTPGAVPAAAPSRPLSITSFVLGLASIVFGWTFLAPVAGIVIGAMALGREPGGRTFAIWGVVLNAVMLAGVIVGLLFALAGIGVGLAFLPFAFL
ncbi:hypothetical protein [Leifsonia sp. NPDC080035]|uniref:DUF4190 domain-containing protein n=1 Tax=Leifsonia sp. NPDC080035 TaxID=3143936 RepID=A0AAU7G992_9MICO